MIWFFQRKGGGQNSLKKLQRSLWMPPISHKMRYRPCNSKRIQKCIEKFYNLKIPISTTSKSHTKKRKKKKCNFKSRQTYFQLLSRLYVCLVSSDINRLGDIWYENVPRGMGCELPQEIDVHRTRSLHLSMQK